MNYVKHFSQVTTQGCILKHKYKEICITVYLVSDGFGAWWKMFIKVNDGGVKIGVFNGRLEQKRIQHARHCGHLGQVEGAGGA